MSVRSSQWLSQEQWNKLNEQMRLERDRLEQEQRAKLDELDRRYRLELNKQADIYWAKHYPTETVNYDSSKNNNTPDTGSDC